MDKDTSFKENKLTIVNTEKSVNETTMLSGNIINDMPSKGPSPTELCSINTDKTGEDIHTEPASILIEQDSDNTTNKIMLVLRMMQLILKTEPPTRK